MTCLAADCGRRGEVGPGGGALTKAEGRAAVSSSLKVAHAGLFRPGVELPSSASGPWGRAIPAEVRVPARSGRSTPSTPGPPTWPSPSATRSRQLASTPSTSTSCPALRRPKPQFVLLLDSEYAEYQSTAPSSAWPKLLKVAAPSRTRWGCSAHPRPDRGGTSLGTVSSRRRRRSDPLPRRQASRKGLLRIFVGQVRIVVLTRATAPGPPNRPRSGKKPSNEWK